MNNDKNMNRKMNDVKYNRRNNEFCCLIIPHQPLRQMAEYLCLISKIGLLNIINDK